MFIRSGINTSSGLTTYSSTCSLTTGSSHFPCIKMPLPLPSLECYLLKLNFLFTIPWSVGIFLPFQTSNLESSSAAFCFSSWSFFIFEVMNLAFAIGFCFSSPICAAATSTVGEDEGASPLPPGFEPVSFPFPLGSLAPSFLSPGATEGSDSSKVTLRFLGKKRGW